MIEPAVAWIRRNTLPGKGIIVHSRQRVPYPEVSGYYIPTLLNIGERGLAHQYASWLRTVQLPDGSIGAPQGSFGYAFDTGQVIRGWVAILPQLPEVETSLRRACDWLITTADSASGRLRVPPPGADWSLGPRGEVNEGIHLYSLGPLRQAGELLGEKRYLDFVTKSVSYYLKRADLTSFDRPNALGHFYAYIQEALEELGYADIAKKGMASVARYQRRDGSVPGYRDVPWVCSTALAQLAKVWYALGETDRADRALDFLSQLQNASGAFFGSYGVRANYFPAQEISWAVKYYVDAQQMRIARHFDSTVGQYSTEIRDDDGRVKAILAQVGDLTGKRVLDAGCGKGRYAGLLKRLFPGAAITAMDISAEMLKHVPSGITTVQNGILNMPFEDGAFDVAICIEALEHVVQIDAGIRELSRVLAPDGRLVVIDKNKDHLGALKMPDWEKWFGRDELLRTLALNGLDANAEDVGGDNRAFPDGLFIAWRGQKTPAASGACRSSQNGENP
jgi:malonyl-CoA O-methyltransferase